MRSSLTAWLTSDASPGLAHELDQEIEANVRWLRTETLGTLLIAVAALLWVGIIPYLLQPDTFWRGWGLLVIALLVTGGCYALRERSYRLARASFDRSRQHHLPPGSPAGQLAPWKRLGRGAGAQCPRESPDWSTAGSVP